MRGGPLDGYVWIGTGLSPVLNTTPGGPLPGDLAGTGNDEGSYDAQPACPN